MYWIMYNLVYRVYLKFKNNDTNEHKSAMSNM